MIILNLKSILYRNIYVTYILCISALLASILFPNPWFYRLFPSYSLLIYPRRPLPVVLVYRNVRSIGWKVGATPDATPWLITHTCSMYTLYVLPMILSSQTIFMVYRFIRFLHQTARFLSIVSLLSHVPLLSRYLPVHLAARHASLTLVIRLQNLEK